MKEEILKKVEEIFEILQAEKIPGMFVANLGGEAIKLTNVGKEGVEELMIVLLDDDAELQDEFLQKVEQVAAETEAAENVVKDISKAE